MIIPSAQTIIKQTQSWVNCFIIHYNICPFAEKVVSDQRIEYRVVDQPDMEDCLLALIEQIIILDGNDETETALLIFPNAVENFDRYLEFLAIANQLIEDQGYSDQFQLASFHPEYCFEGDDQDDAANFTNRAPWPMIHIIRQSSIEKGLKFYENPEQIPVRNIKLTRELGFDFLSELRARCMSEV